MQIAFNKRTALAIIRSLRSDPARRNVFARRADLVPPDPFPRKRWSRKLFDTLELGLPIRLADLPIEVAVSEASKRLGTQGVLSTTYSNDLPKGSFIDLGNGIVVSGPELLFVEMAGVMNPVEHLVLGHELCGSFGRDALDPYNGSVVYGVQPLTSVERIRRFLNEARYIHGIDEAAISLSYLNDNAWSPTESLIAALLRLPVDSMGFDIGELELNPRAHLSSGLPGAKKSRVPDIMIVGSSVGVNYDGLVHLDLDSVVSAALDVGAHPEFSQTQVILDKTVRSVRAKAVDDIRRNRELAAGGMFVFPVVKEDLYVPGGFDAIVELLLDALEVYSGRDVTAQRKILCKKALSRERHRVIRSLLPGDSERGIQLGWFIDGHQVGGEHAINEYLIEF